MPYIIDGQTPRNDDISHIWTKVRAYAPEGLFSRGEAIRLGDFVTGIVCANYGGSGRDNLHAWGLAGWSEWRYSQPGTMINPGDVDFREWATDWLPTLDGAAFAVGAPGENRILGARVLPTDGGPHISIRARRGRLRLAGEEANRTGAPPRVRQVNFLAAGSYARPRRRSVSRTRNQPSP